MERRVPTHIVMDHTGDSRHVFDRNDAEALARAEERFKELTGEGFAAAVREGEGQSRLIKAFDPAA
jgi:tetrahydromethanopterin S-methyltransferase subunit H